MSNCFTLAILTGQYWLNNSDILHYNIHCYHRKLSPNSSRNDRLVFANLPQFCLRRIENELRWRKRNLELRKRNLVTIARTELVQHSFEEGGVLLQLNIKIFAKLGIFQRKIVLEKSYFLRIYSILFDHIFFFYLQVERCISDTL